MTNMLVYCSTNHFHVLYDIASPQLILVQLKTDFLKKKINDSNLKSLHHEIRQ